MDNEKWTKVRIVREVKSDWRGRYAITRTYHDDNLVRCEEEPCGGVWGEEPAGVSLGWVTSNSSDQE